MKTRDKDWVSAGTVSWATQSSFDPILVTVAIQKDSDLNETIQKSQVFSLTVIGKDEKSLIEKFANKRRWDYSDNKVNGVSYKEGSTGAPLLGCGVATLECNPRRRPDHQWRPLVSRRPGSRALLLTAASPSPSGRPASSTPAPPPAASALPALAPLGTNLS